MREKKRDVEPRDKIEEKDAGNKRVLGANEVKHEQSDTGDGLPKTEPVWAQQFVLQKIIFRTGQRFQNHSDNKHAAVSAVALPGQGWTRRIKRDHEPDADPEKGGHHYNLAEQEDAVETLRPLRDHGYCT